MIARLRGPAAAAALALLLAGCAPAERSAESPGARWSRTHAALDSLGAEGATEAALARLAAESGVTDAPAWLTADLEATLGSWQRRAGMPAEARASLVAADFALRRAQAMLAQDSLAAASATARACLDAREAQLGPADPSSLRAALAQAEVAFRMGRPGEADSLASLVWERLSPLARTAHPLAAEAEALRGRVLKNFTGGPARDEAMAHYERARAIRERACGEQSLEVAVLYQEMGNLERTSGRFEDALEHFEQALGIRRARLGAVHEVVASTLSAMAHLFAWEGDWRAAERSMRRSLAASPDPDALAPATSCLRQGLLGQALRRQGRSREAIEPLSVAAAAAESAWARSGRDGGSSVQSGLSIHRELAMALAAEGQGEAAFVELERGQSRGWAEAEGGPDPWTGLLARVQRACPDDAALIAWPRTTIAPQGGDYPVWACIVRSRGPVLWVRLERLSSWMRRDLTVREALIGEIVRASLWPIRIEDTHAVDSLATEMGREWFVPLEPHLAGVKRLIVFGPEMMASAPLGILRDSRGRPVDERFTIRYAPSALAFAALAERPALAVADARTALLVGAPLPAAADSARFAPLTGAAGELAALAARFPNATVLTGAAASASRLRALEARGDLARASVLHLATHTDIVVSRMMQSSFVLSPDVQGGRTSSRLTANEIASDWRLRARLVSLAGCRSVMGPNSASEGWLGLQSAFLTAGARSVLVSVWRADDEATSRLMTDFYARLTHTSAPVDAAEALRLSQQSLRTWRSPDGRTPYAHPVYWAGFALVGAGE